MNKSYTTILLIAFFALSSQKVYSQDKLEDKTEKKSEQKGHMFSYYKIHDPEYTWTSVVRFLGVKSFFYTAVLPIHKKAVLKPEILMGTVNEATVWYSYNFTLSKHLKLGFFTGPGVSYSNDEGQGARFRWQYGFGTPTIAEDIPISLFILSNITHDFNSDFTVWDWYNFGIAYQLNRRVKIQIDMEGNFLGNPYQYTNMGFVVDL